jgi:hypothetical protein
MATPEGRPVIDRLVLHVGVQKTASSLIQRSMRQLRPHLRQAGIAYIGRQQTHGLEGRTSWAAYGKGDPAIADAYAAGLREVVSKEMRAVPDLRTVLLSNESMIGRVGPEYGDPFWPRAEAGVRQVIDWLEPRSTEIWLYVRRQDRLLESLYMQAIHRGGTRRWPVFQAQVCSDVRVRYVDLVGLLETLPTVAAVRVRPFEIIEGGPRRFIRDFLAPLGGRKLVDHLERTRKSNPSYTQPAYAAARVMNRHMDAPEQVALARRTLRKIFPQSKYPRADLMSDEDRAAFLAMHAGENETLFRKYLADFPESSYTAIEVPDELTAHLVPQSLVSA